MSSRNWILVAVGLVLMTFPGASALGGEQESNTTPDVAEPELNLGVCELFDDSDAVEHFTPVATLLAACCFPDGTCENLPRAQCFADGGWPHRTGTYCASIECHSPDVVACCLPDGTCEELQPRICHRQDGQPHYAPGDCSDVECTVTP